MRIEAYISLSVDSENEERTHVRPGDEVIGCLFQGLYRRMRDNFHRKVNARAKLDQSEARLAPAGVPANLDVRFEVWDDTVVTIDGLFGHGFEEEVHSIDEALSASRPAFLHKTAKEANQ